MFSGYYICKIMVVIACFLIQAGVTPSSVVTNCKNNQSFFAVYPLHQLPPPLLGCHAATLSQTILHINLLQEGPIQTDLSLHYTMFPSLSHKLCSRTSLALFPFLSHLYISLAALKHQTSPLYVFCSHFYRSFSQTVASPSTSYGQCYTVPHASQ